jgi:hypothetical protein
MKSPVKFEYVQPTDNDLKAQLQTFANSFDHSIETWSHPIFIAKTDNKWIGYIQIVNQPTVFTAWKPEAASARTIIEAMLQLVGWVRFQFGSGFTTVPLDTKSFFPSVMKKLGFKRMNLELYEPENT